MNVSKVVKTIGIGLQVLGAVGAVIGAGYEIGDNVNKLKELKNQNTDIDSVASKVEVEA